jgi:hypothetical protein
LGALLAGCADGPSDRSEGTSASSRPSPSETPPSATATGPALTTSTPTSTDTATAPPSSSVPLDAASGEPSGAAALWGSEYSGTAEISVDVYDYCGGDGSRRLADTRTYSMAGTLSLSRPRTGGGESEDNPFSLVLGVGQPSEAGAVSFWSAAVSTVSSQDLAGNPRDPNLLLTYWDLDWTDGRLSGRLTDPHTEEAVALNLLNWPTAAVACRPEFGELPGAYPHALGTGTTLDGQLGSGSASLTAEGGTSDGQLEFRFDFSGSS